MTTHIDDLNMKVTGAILSAERIADGTPEAKTAWLEVAFAEETLSAFTTPQSVEGEICRRGAVTAALRAGEPSYARGLCRGYLSEDLAPASRELMQKLLNEASDELGLDVALE
jgi:hypothetical protein